MFLAKRYLNYTLTITTIIVLSFAMILTGDAEIDKNMIQGMWTFEEGEGENVTDLSGNGSDGIFVGDVKWVEGKFGGGIEFSGVEAQNHVRIGRKGDPETLAALNFKDSEGFSIHAWRICNGITRRKMRYMERARMFKLVTVSTWNRCP